MDALDYKGHVRMQCSDGCNIAYHPACWRRFKSDSVLGADKDFLGTMCKTPDCEGEIRNVYIYDTKGGLKKVRMCVRGELLVGRHFCCLFCGG